MLQTIPTLGISLPPYPEGYLHQLGFVGAIRVEPTSTDLKQVELHFHPKPLTRLTTSSNEPFRRWVSLTKVDGLVPGSLWDNSGTMASDGHSYVPPGSPADSSLPVLEASLTFKLGNSPSTVRQLGELLPEDVTRSPLLATVADGWFLVLEQDGRRILIPCFELLRAFYYVEADPLLDFYFSYSPLDTVCKSIVQPRAENKYYGRVEIASDAFSLRQQAVLAELAFNPAFYTCSERTHNALLGGILQTNAGAFPKVDFQLGRDMDVTATGFTFKRNEVEHFWVCNIRRCNSAIWSCRNLEVDFLLNHSSNQVPKGAKKNSTYASGSLLTPRFSTGRVATMNQAGNSRHSGVEATLTVMGIAELPRISHSTKAVNAFHYPGTLPRIEIPASGISAQGGGSDESVAKAKITRADVEEVEPKKKPPQVAVPVFFQEIVTWFTNKKGFKAEVLKANNAKEEHGDGVSVFPFNSEPRNKNFFIGTGEDAVPRQQYIVRIVFKNKVFYFSQSVERGRAALFYFKSLVQLEAADFLGLNQILTDYAAANFNWLTLKQVYAKPAKEGELPIRKRLMYGLQIHPRNHTRTDANQPSAAALCEQQIRRVVKAFKKKPS